MEEQFRRQVEKLARIPDAEWETFQKVLEPRELKRHEVFLEQGKVCRHMAFIVKGYVRFFFLTRGTEVTKEFSFENLFAALTRVLLLAIPLVLL